MGEAARLARDITTSVLAFPFCCVILLTLYLPPWRDQ